MAIADHLCDDQCVCPVHGTPLYYWPAGDDHACQDAQCRYAHGMNDTVAAGRETWTSKPRLADPSRESYAYTCLGCSWHTKDSRYEQHVCRGGRDATNPYAHRCY